MAVQVVGENGLTPLFRAWGIARPMRFGKPRAVRRGLEASSAGPASKPGFGVVDYEDFAVGV
jgi:hypothetical protein